MQIVVLIFVAIAVVVLSVWPSKPPMFCCQVQGNCCDAGLCNRHVHCSQLSATSSCSQVQCHHIFLFLFQTTFDVDTDQEFYCFVVYRQCTMTAATLVFVQQPIMSELPRFGHCSRKVPFYPEDRSAQCSGHLLSRFGSCKRPFLL